MAILFRFISLVLLVQFHFIACSHAQKNTATKTEPVAEQTAAKPKSKNEKNVEAKILSSIPVQKLFQRQALRREPILSAKSKGWLGETSQGLLQWRETSKVPKNQMAKLKKVVDQENKDRESFYKLVVKESGYNSIQEKVLRQSMFQSHLDSDPIGVYFLRDKVWEQKK